MDKQLYFDNYEDGLNILTSHPVFRQFFSDDLYYDCANEEAPFGNDEGSDTLYELQDCLRNRHTVDFADFPRWLIEEEWEMTYLSPQSEQTDEQLWQQAAQTIDGLPGEQGLLLVDQVILATAFGQLKITGQLDDKLQNMAFQSLDRQEKMCRLFWNWQKAEPPNALAIMRRDLTAYANSCQTAKC